MSPGESGGSPARSAVVVVQAEGVEGLIPQVQQGGELRDLLLAAQVLQAVAHGRAPPAPVVAQGTVRCLLQGVGGVAGLVQQGGLLVLEGQVLPAQGGQSLLLAQPLAEGGGQNPGGGLPQLAVNLRGAGQGPVDLRPAAGLVLLGGPAGPA